MKQNERLLVYAVTGFLALILVIAVLFGNDPVNAASKQEKMSKGLSEILQPKGSVAADDQDDEGAKGADVDGEDDSKGEVDQQPLIAKPILASAVVERALGASRRDRFVRFVPVKRGDAFETLVRRWCGSTDGFLEEAYGLNEHLRDMKVLRAGAEVAVPWVDDEVLAAVLEAQAPRKLAASGDVLLKSPAREAAGVPTADNSKIRKPSFDVPGTGTGTGAGAGVGAGAGTAGAGPAVALVTYKVKPNDSLWKIASRLCAKNEVQGMIRTIKELNPGVPELLPIGYELQLPPKAN